jgi:hypothetical protein
MTDDFDSLGFLWQAFNSLKLNRSTLFLFSSQKKRKKKGVYQGSNVSLDCGG